MEGIPAQCKEQVQLARVLKVCRSEHGVGLSRVLCEDGGWEATCCLLACACQWAMDAWVSRNPCLRGEQLGGALFLRCHLPQCLLVPNVTSLLFCFTVATSPLFVGSHCCLPAVGCDAG